MASSHFLIDDAIVAVCADFGLSMAATARVLGVTRSTIAGRARDAGISFHGPQTVGGGCTSEQARKGWETRREKSALVIRHNAA